jgi:hypothetical protein
MGTKWNAYRFLIEKPVGNSPLRNTRRRWEDNIKIDLVEVGWGYVNWACSTKGG